MDTLNLEVLKEGKPECRHSWIISDFKPETPPDTYDFQRICRTCGRLEHIIQEQKVASFEETYQQFYGGK